MRWIDTHVHLFSENNGDNTGIPLLYSRQALNTPDLYMDILGEKKPEGIVVVDFSKSKSSEHVINSLEELKTKQIKSAGIIKGNTDDERTFEWIERHDIKGIRLYAQDSIPNLSGDKWKKIFDIIKTNNQHILVFGGGEHLSGLIEQIPEDIIILIDHLGLPKISDTDANFKELLFLAQKRMNIYFKGPGYRTSLDIEKVKPVIKEIVNSVGINHLILGASDGPFAGPVLPPSPQYERKMFGEVMDYENVLNFIEKLAISASNNDSDVEKLLYSNAMDLYEF